MATDASVVASTAAVHQTLTPFKATFITSGMLAGVGVPSIPHALSNAGWVGALLIVVIGLISAYTCLILSKCWLMLQQRYPNDKLEFCRYPYPALGEYIFGIWGRRIVSANIFVTSFGGGTIFLIVTAQNVQTFVRTVFGPDVTLCWYLLIMGGLFIPLTVLESPKDFWQLGFIAYAATFVMLILVLIGSIITYADKAYVRPIYTSPTFPSFFQSFGTYMLAYTVHTNLLTIQNDMREQSKFARGIRYAFAITILSYLPVPLFAYVVFGSGVNANVLVSLPAGPIQYVGLVVVTGHVLLASNIGWNTLFQDVERLLNVKQHGFSLKRVGVRGSMIATTVFIALTIPHFGPLVDLVGSLTNTSLAFIFPPIFYYLCSRKVLVTEIHDGRAADASSSRLLGRNSREIPLWEKVVLLEIFIVGVMALLVGTYFSLYELLRPGSFYAPCYVSWWRLTMSCASGRNTL